jgi:hypothetical protein
MAPEDDERCLAARSIAHMANLGVRGENRFLTVAVL